MDTIPLIWEEAPPSADGTDSRTWIGTAVLEEQPLHMGLRVHAPVRSGLWCAWVVGEQGEARIGILEPTGGELGIFRRISRQTIAPLGRLLRVELRIVRDTRWKRAEGLRFRDPWIRQWAERSGYTGEVLEQVESGRRRVALPRRDSDPFPLPPLFCFAHSQRIGDRDCWVFHFDSRDQPVL